MKNLFFGGVIIVIAFLGAADAFAAGSGRSSTPEYFYQPNVNNFNLSFSYEQFMPSPSNQTWVSNIKQSENAYTHTGYGLDAGYGLSDAWALTGSLHMANDQTNYTAPGGNYSLSSSGLKDVLIKLSNITALGSWSLNVGITAGLSPGKHKVAVAGGAAGDEVSGGTSIINYVGLSTILGSNNYFGVKLQYTTRTERTFNNNAQPTASDYRVTGGNAFLLGTFLETAFTDFSADVQANMQFFDPLTYTYADGSVGTYDATKTYGLGLGVQYQITASSNFRVAYDLTLKPDIKNGNTTEAAYNESLLTARLRFEF